MINVTAQLNRLPALIKLAPVYLVVAACLVAPIVTKIHNQNQLAAADLQASARIAAAYKIVTPSQQAPAIQGRPVRVVISSVGIDDVIVDGKYNATTKQWSVAHDQANYAVNTPLVNNQNGSPLVYGHWYDWVLGKTRDLKPGAIAYVYTDTGHVFEYKYTGASIVDPTDTDIFNSVYASHGLKLLTCEGTWAQHRRIMSFDYVAAS